MRNKSRVYDNDWPIVAICYDFDKTLSPKDMQEFDLIPKLKCSSEEFWNESNGRAKKSGMDKILAYMLTIVQRAGDHISIKENDFKKLGGGIELFPGVDTWFDRVNKIALNLQVNVEHYIISAGLKEIIKGTPIAKHFEEIYASSFLYNTYGKPIWPRQVVNYTTKTQYLFRISKDCLDLSDEDAVNEYQESEKRRIPFSNFIYIGDSETDIPAMKIVKNGGGISIGVYNPQTRNMDRVRKLLKQERIDFLMPADYSEGGRIERLVKNALVKIRDAALLTQLNRRQKDYVEDLEFSEGLIGYTDNFIDREALNEQDISNVKRQAHVMIKKLRKKLHEKYNGISSEEEIDEFMNGVESNLNKVIDDKKRKAKQRRMLPSPSESRNEVISDESNDKD